MRRIPRFSLRFCSKFCPYAGHFIKPCHNSSCAEASFIDGMTNVARRSAHVTFGGAWRIKKRLPWVNRFASLALNVISAAKRGPRSLLAPLDCKLVVGRPFLLTLPIMTHFQLPGRLSTASRLLALFTLLVAAAVIDVRRQRIPNWLT